MFALREAVAHPAHVHAAHNAAHFVLDVLWWLDDLVAAHFVILMPCWLDDLAGAHFVTCVPCCLGDLAAAHFTIQVCA